MTNDDESSLYKIYGDEYFPYIIFIDGHHVIHNNKISKRIWLGIRKFYIFLFVHLVCVGGLLSKKCLSKIRFMDKANGIHKERPVDFFLFS